MALVKFYSITFSVEGSGRFPFDMLRYDNCCPFSQEDVSNLNNDRENRMVRLTRFYPVGGRPESTAARWQSFGWRVVEQGRGSGRGRY